MAKSPESVFIKLESILDNYDGYERRLRAYKYLYKLLHNRKKLSKKAI